MNNRNHFYAHLALPEGSNDVFVYWNEMDGDQNNRGIYGQKISSTGSVKWGSNGKVFIEISSTNVSPMASRKLENDMVVIYEEYFNSMDASVKAMRIDSDGLYVWTPENITMSSVQSTKGHPDVSSFIFGQCIAVWDDDRNGSGDIYGQKYPARWKFR